MPTDGGAGGSGVVINLNNPGNNQQVNDGNNPNSGGGAGGSPDYLSAFTNEDNRKYAEQKGWKDPDAQLKSYRDLETAYSRLKSGQPNGQPGNGGGGDQPVIPNSPADYEFKLPDGFPQDSYDKNLAELFRGWSHKAKLSTAQAQHVHDQMIGHMSSVIQSARTEQAKQLNDRVAASFNDLTKEWGQPGTPGFNRALEMGRRAIAQLDPGLKDALVAHGVIGKDAKGQEVVVNATIFKVLSKVGGRLFAEDEVFGQPAASENPFDPKKPNATKAGELIRKNPELARSLINAAGPEAVKDWSWWLSKK